MAEWIADLLGWDLTSSGSVTEYVYMIGLVVVATMVLIVFAELAGMIRDLISSWGRK